VEKPFLRMDSPDAVDILTDAFVEVLRERGVDQLSVGALARWMKVTPAAILKSRKRSTVLEQVVAEFGRRWLAWSCPEHGDDIPVRLPRTDEERHGVLVWFMVTELCRGEEVAGRPRPRQLLDDARSRDDAHLRVELQHRLGRAPSQDERDLVRVATDGLRWRLAIGDPALDHARGRALIRTLLFTLIGSAPAT
jgi:hypothetical protein